MKLLSAALIALALVVRGSRVVRGAVRDADARADRQTGNSRLADRQFVVARTCGNSRPASVRVLLHDIALRANTLAVGRDRSASHLESGRAGSLRGRCHIPGPFGGLIE